MGADHKAFSMFEKQARANMEMFENAMRMFTPGMKPRSKSKKSGQDMSDPGNEAVSILRAQMEAMQEQLDALAGKR